jgi:thioesterase domain-containing protein
MDVADDFFAIGGHSLMAVQLFARIEREFGLALPLSTLFNHSTVEDLARVLDGTSEATPWRPLVPIRVRGTRPPLFLVHGLGGEVFGFRALAAQLRADQPVYGIQGTGPTTRQDLPVEVEALAALYADLLLAVDPAGPYAIGGYSSGGVLALELGQELFRRGHQVAALIVIDGGLPPSATRPHARRHTFRSFAQQAAYWSVDHAMAISARSWWNEIRSKARLLATRMRSHATRAKADVRDRLGLWSYPDHYREYLERRYDEFLRYEPKPYPGHVTLIRARSGGLFWSPSVVLDEAWRDIAKGGFEVVRISTGHARLLEEPFVGQVAREAQTRLDRAMGRS